MQLLAVNLFSLGEAAFLSLVSSQDFDSLVSQLRTLLARVAPSPAPSGSPASDAASAAGRALHASGGEGVGGPLGEAGLWQWLHRTAPEPLLSAAATPELLAVAAAGAAALGSSAKGSARLCATITQPAPHRSKKGAAAPATGAQASAAQK